MFNIDLLRKKAQSYYDSGKFYSDLLSGNTIFPLRYSFKRPTEKVFVSSIEEIQKSLSSLKKFDRFIEYSAVEYKRVGSQRLPSVLCFKTLDDYLQFLGKSKEYQAFVEGFESAKSLGLGEFLRQKPLILLKHLDVWDRIISVVQFFLLHPKPNIYIRELPIEGVDTKFIQSHKKVLDTLLQVVLSTKFYNSSITKLSDYGFEKKYGLRYPLSRVRFRSNEIETANIDDIEITCEAFNTFGLKAKYIFIIENLTTFLAFPLFSDVIILYGGGFKAGQFRQLDLDFAEEIFYWGDIDTHGFAILSSFRSIHPNVQSFLMDKETLYHFSYLCVQEPTPTTANLPNLMPKELEVYDALRFKEFKGLRLEQERIPINWLMEKLEEKIK
ncbi:Wadjet anti-phage system protein JetD domain-containing protein [Hydrogenimonas thermophila]|uniref:Wadjet protein JetD C-terminal domain-containing protein n=1 Tax=Hydrogenimonas thermophila TaxID=223786 RepID=A0A1I5N5F7_9BACT|nr:Wadjet anti-phage system protein JetD domain-containing protein [Hydrogenimonas thermophila]WOE70262.1 DUF2220 family protein [Hydrogenimonas thermophila]WOE72779.1 DUF2220 family protein [Hydrogenimonas thermophila]SFP16930.1 hypothetical protein SAMN05216234_10863 [Hydrogenimonas thermophila]